MPSPVRKFFVWLILLPLAIVAAAFAVANRAPVAVSLDPLPYILDLPLYSLVLGAGFAGFIIGAAAAWLSGHKSRKALRQARRQLTRTERELHGLRAQRAAPANQTAEPASVVAATGTRDQG